MKKTAQEKRTVQVVQETQIFNIEQFDIFTTNKSQAIGSSSNSQATNFKAFNSLFGSKELSAVKVTFKMTGLTETASFQIDSDEVINDSLLTNYSMSIKSDFTENTPKEESFESEEVLSDSSNTTISEDELDAIINNSESVIPSSVNETLTIGSEYSFTAEEIKRVASGEIPNFSIEQILRGEMTSISNNASQALFRSVLKGSIVLEYTYKEVK